MVVIADVGGGVDGGDGRDFMDVSIVKEESIILEESFVYLALFSLKGSLVFEVFIVLRTSIVRV